MGATISKEAIPPSTSTSTSTSSKEVHKAGDSSSPSADADTSGCPVQTKKKKKTEEDGWRSFIPFEAEHHPLHPHHPQHCGPSCRTHVKTLDSHTEYNVYGQKINPDNQMPTQPHQQPAPGQQTPLSTERVNSTIPKGGTVQEGTTWTYPSPQMFYNALVRKNKLDDTSECDMESVVAVHNRMNEQTWAKILQFEQTLGHESSKLLKFNGRPKDLSPKATLKHYVFGHPLPFDRHDWFIERDNGEIVRYVLDYYAGIDHSLHVDVRPAIDSPRALLDRGLIMPYYQWRQETAFTPLPLVPSNVLKDQYEESQNIWKNLIQGGSSSSSSSSSSKLPTVADLLQEECRAAAAAVSACANDTDCQKATIDLTLCLGKRLCPTEYTAMQQSNTDDGIESALHKMQACVNQYRHE